MEWEQEALELGALELELDAVLELVLEVWEPELEVALVLELVALVLVLEVPAVLEWAANALC